MDTLMNLRDTPKHMNGRHIKGGSFGKEEFRCRYLFLRATLPGGIEGVEMWASLNEGRWQKVWRGPSALPHIETIAIITQHIFRT